MKKLITALMIVLPLVLLIALFTVTNVTRITTKIPATGIQISNKGDNGVFTFDIADYAAPMYEEDLGIEVLPYVASNRDYTLSITDAESGKESNIVTLNDDGSFALHDAGVAKLTYTSKDGGYSDSVLFNVSCSGVLKLETPTVLDLNGNEYSLEKGTNTDYAVTIESGIYNISANFYPATATSSQAHYSAQNSDAVYINEVSGKMHARFSGNHVVEVSVADAYGNQLKQTVELRVQKSSDVTLNAQSVQSGANDVSIVAPLNSTSFTLYADCPVETELDDIVLAIKGVSENSCVYSVRKLGVSDTSFAIDVILDHAYTETQSQAFSLVIKDKKYDFAVEFADYAFAINSQFRPLESGDILVFDGTQTRLSISTEPENPDIRYTWKVDDGFENMIEIISQEKGYCTVIAPTCGRPRMIVVCEEYRNGEWVTVQTVEQRLTVAKRYTSLLFSENAQNYGLGILAIANQKYDSDGNLVKVEYESGFCAYNGKDKMTPNQYGDIDFTTSNSSIADIRQDSQGVFVQIKSTGKATVKATYKYGDVLGIAPVTFTFNAVAGVEVSDYQQLVKASKNGLRTVLANDVYLGENLFDVNSDGSRTQKYDDATMKEKLLSYTQEIATTFDWTYYKNTGSQSAPTLRYCFEFTNDFYGNGHTLNAEYITNMTDTTDNLYDFAVFRGPLDFVSTSQGGIKVAAVKGQDNIAYLVRKDNICIDNTVLKGCDDESLYDNGEFNLSLLNYTGTTLEIMSNASVTNSRIMNGRTVMRVFGRDGISSEQVNPADEKIFVTIDGCVLQNAREFILKIGTNRFMRDTSVPNPSLYDENGQAYTNNNSSACDNYANDEYFVQNYVLTDIVLKDSVLRTSGLFSIGMESHFAGTMLNGGSQFKLEGWHDLAATSYPAFLHLVGDVKLLDWKPLSSVDSSTLIETPTSNGSNLAFLSLNIGEMLQAVKEYGGYNDIIDDINGEDYVHGGIAFYGGGRNYSMLDTSQYTFAQMNEYNVNISILAQCSDSILKQQGQLLPLAAGTHDFRFVMFDATSDFRYPQQQETEN